MSAFDVVVRGGCVVLGDAARRLDVGIIGGRIAALETELTGDGKETIDADGLHVLPGVIDSHVHFNEPGRADWEGIETGSGALAAGGATLFFDMPLNAHPPTVDAEGFRLKQEAAEAKSVTDFALWGGLVPGNLDRMEELAACGVIGFKAFMCSSGIDDFPSVDDSILRVGMKRAATLGLPVAVHAENESLMARPGGRTGIRDFLDSRPVAAELDAIGRAIDLAGETGCALHVVHVSCGAGVRLIANARARNVDVTCETCPHYLALTCEDVERIGPPAKCAPPLRTAEAQNELWDELLEGKVTTVGSDHSPSPPEMKTGDNFFNVWGGISGVQHLLPLLLTLGLHERGADLAALARLFSGNVAGRFKLPEEKGRIVTGADADLALVDLGRRFEVRKEDLFYRHRQSPYVGRQLRGVVCRTLVRGRTVFQDGKVMAKAGGVLVKPVL